MTILDQQVALQSNLLFALQRYRILWVLLALTAIIDYVTTINFMTNGSISLEGNLIVRHLAYGLGIYPGVLIGKVLQIFAAMAFCALTREYGKGILVVIIGLNCVASYFNFIYG